LFDEPRPRPRLRPPSEEFDPPSPSFPEFEDESLRSELPCEDSPLDEAFLGDRLDRDGLDSDRASSLEAGESFADELFVPERELFFAIKHLIFVVPKRHRMSV
jgi:hypothetical protein